ncbi:signal peptidase I [Candidatus Azambacteria bacterium]|nr:signal peptidase I [Candidatus Azambacteria bacterium]
MDFKKIFSFLWETAKLVLISLAIILPLRYYVVQPFFVLGASMEPSFENGDYLIIDEVSYRVGEPARGDVVVFKYPYDTKQYYIKRIVGLPGEIVGFKDGRIVIKNKDNPNGFSLDEKYLASPNETFGGGEVKLGYNEYFVLGDNRGASSDSRRWGALKNEFIVGRVVVRVFPFNEFSIFK